MCSSDLVRRHSRVNDAASARAFDEDSSYYLLCSLENLDEDRRFVGKSDMFTKRTIRQNVVPTSAGTPQEALLLSVSEKARVDMDYMALNFTLGVIPRNMNFLLLRITLLLVSSRFSRLLFACITFF